MFLFFSPLIFIDAVGMVAQVLAVPFVVVTSNTPSVPRLGHAVAGKTEFITRKKSPCRANRFREKAVDVSNLFREALGLPLIKNLDDGKVSFLFVFFSSHISSQNEQIFNHNCTKDPDSASSKVSLGKGPTQSSSTAPSPRSQSPAPSTPVLQTHSRRPSALLVQATIPIKNGLSKYSTTTAPLKGPDSSSSYVSWGKGPTPVIIHSAFSTLSISSPIDTRSPNSFSSSQRTSPGYTHQRWR
jgi:hypothetical protein